MWQVPRLEREAMRLAASRVTIAIGMWVLGVGAGFWVLETYNRTPGLAALTPEDWPSASAIVRSRDHATLIMLAHPHCPCSRASIGELAQLMTDAQGRVSAFVLFLRPTELAADWNQTDLWHSARNIPGVTVVTDPDGREAQRFNATTSGQVLLYDRDGRRVFSGGITAARGHAGDNPGRRAILSFLSSGHADQRETQVFGCSLHDTADAAALMETAVRP
jgi:hypothetical protein